LRLPVEASFDLAHAADAATAGEKPGRRGKVVLIP
jgi:hypothetical protein